MSGRNFIETAITMKSLQTSIIDQSNLPSTPYRDRVLQELRELRVSGKGKKWEDFSFEKTRKLLKDVPDNWSDDFIEMKNEELGDL